MLGTHVAEERERVGSDGVDEGGLAFWGWDDDGVGLADVEEGDLDEGVGLGGVLCGVLGSRACGEAEEEGGEGDHRTPGDRRREQPGHGIKAVGGGVWWARRVGGVILQSQVASVGPINAVILSATASARPAGAVGSICTATISTRRPSGKTSPST